MGCRELQGGYHVPEPGVFPADYGKERSETMQLTNVRFSFGQAIRKELPSILSTVLGATLLGITVFFALLFA